VGGAVRRLRRDAGGEAAGGSRYAGAEPHHLLAAASLADGLDLDLADEYARGLGDRWTAGGRLRTDGRVVAGRLVEPHGLGFGLLLAPAYALGGATLAVVLLAAVAALAFVLGAALARRVVPDPWATWAALLAGLSPPALAHSTAVLPALTAGALLAGAALCTLAVREHPLMRGAYGAAALLALLPWLDPWLLVPAAPVAILLARWTARGGRRLVAYGTAELQLASLVFYVALNERLYGGFTPLAVAEAPVTGASSVGDYAARLRASRSCSSTATSGCCAGRRCSRWRFWARGCSGALAASGWHGSWPSSATPSMRRSSRWPCAERRSWSRPSRRARSADRGSPGRSSWRRCRAPCRRSPGGCAVLRWPAGRWAR
jgi:hypothetical protein